MKRAGLVSYAIVVALLALGSIALAAPPVRVALQAETGATGSTGDGTGPTGGSGPIEAPAPLAPEEEGDDDGGTAPDFTGCEGMTGLDNAICRHEALLVIHPDNRGLQHSLDRLEANSERHEAKRQSKAEDGSEGHPGKGNGGNPHDPDGSGSGAEATDPGDGPGRGNGNGHANGHDEGDAGEG